MTDGLCMNCFNVKGKYRVCQHCGHAEGTPPRQPYHLTPGTRLSNGRYIIGMSIGVGGFSVIYKAYDTSLGIITAVKEFYPAGLVNRAPGTKEIGFADGDKQEEFQKNKNDFLMEAQIISRFSKADDIVRVFDRFEENGTVYIVMEYMEGVLLKDFLARNGRLEPKKASVVALRIIEAVKKLHEQGVIHRDISPDNIFCMPDGIKLFDFGAARRLGKDTENFGQAVIKPGYAPPEQYLQKGKQGFYTDIYAIGAVLYEMMTGIHPVEAVERMEKDTLKKPGELGISAGANLERTVMKAMALDPSYRFSNVEEFKEALCNKRAAEFPEVEKRRKKIRRSLTAVAFSLILLAASIGYFLLAAGRRGGPLDVQLSEDAIAVWIPVQRQPESGTIEFDKENAEGRDFSTECSDYKTQQRFYDAAETICMFLTDEEFPDNENIEVSLIPVLENEYAQAYEEAVSGSGSYEEPTLFLTEGLLETSHDSYADLSALYQSLELDEYYFLSEYGELFPDRTQIPAGFDTLFLYWRSRAGGKKTQLKLAKDAETVDLVEDILDPAGQGEKRLEDFVGWDSGQFANTLYLLDPRTADSAEKTAGNSDKESAEKTAGNSDKDSAEKTAENSAAGKGGAVFSEESIQHVQLMYKMQDAVTDAHGKLERWFDSRSSSLAGIISDSTLLRSKTISAARGNYEVSLLTAGGRALAVCRDVYAVCADAGENQQNAAMRLLAYLFTHNVQNLSYQQHQRALPLRRDVFKAYMGSEKQLSRALKQPMLDLGTDFDMLLKQGEDHQAACRRNEDLNRDIFGKAGMDAGDIAEYLRNYD